jgi:hypothetical protein
MKTGAFGFQNKKGNTSSSMMLQVLPEPYVKHFDNPIHMLLVLSLSFAKLL